MKKLLIIGLSIILAMGSCSKDDPKPEPKIIDVESVEVTPKALTLVEGDIKQLTTKILPTNATDTTILWNSSNEEIAKIDHAGMITTIKEGKVTITASSNNDKTSVCELTVTKKIIEVTEIQLDVTSLEITEGDTKQLKATIFPENATDKNITWSSSNEEIASVSEDGLVTALKHGECDIIATSNNNIEGVCKVVIKELELSKYIKLLKSAEFGWKAVYAGNNISYGANYFIFKFDSKEVTIESNDNVIFGEFKGHYTVKSDLIKFDEQTIFGKRFDPKESEFNLYYDCEFKIESSDENTITLVGTTFKTKIILNKMISNDKAFLFYYRTQSKNLQSVFDSNSEEKHYKILKLKGASEKCFEIDFGKWLYEDDSKTIMLTHFDGESDIKEIYQYYYTENGFKLYTPINVDGKKIFAFQYNESKKTMIISDSEGLDGEVSFSHTPPYVRTGIAKDFVNTSRQMVFVPNTELAKSFFDNVAKCNVFMGSEIIVFNGHESDGEVISSLMFDNNEGSRRYVDMSWEIEGEDGFKGTVITDSENNKNIELSEEEKNLVDLYSKGFYLSKNADVFGYETYMLVSKQNSAISFGVFMMDTKK